MQRNMRFLSFLSCCIIFLSGYVYSEEYGLGFYGHDVYKDYRTQLELNPDRYIILKDEVELKFNFRLRPDMGMYFGYIARIIDDSGNNVDILFDYRSSSDNSINIVGRRNFTALSLKTNYQELTNNWTEYSLHFDANRQTLSISSPDTTLVATGMDLDRRIKIFFGGNNHSFYRTTDVPPMYIRDVQILRKGRLIHHFPFDESSGSMAIDRIGKLQASVNHPIWIRSSHTFWKEEFTTNILGHAMFAFNPAEEEVFMIGERQIVKFSVRDSVSEIIEVNMQSANMIPGSQAFYDTINDKLICYNVDKNIAIRLDISAPELPEQEVFAPYLTEFWHHNKYFHSSQEAIYIFGGYGQYEYKNLVQRFDFSTSNLELVDVAGDIFNPRYMSALGVLNDTVYLLGGYGSISGSQMLNPTNYLDMMAFSLENHNFTKLFDLPAIEDAIAFANSMFIDPETRNYYALYLPFFRFEGYLQLISGNLSSPDYRLLGNQIPYLFHDTQSFADLYFCESSSKLVAVTSYTDQHSMSQVSVHSIAFPPNTYLADIQTSTSKHSSYQSLIIILISMLIVGAGGYFIYKGRKKKRSPAFTREENKWQNSILFFGGFQAFNKNGADITAKFTPLIRELFLIIWFFSLKENKGISSELLVENLWFGSSRKRAKNSMAVNIARLKQLLNEFETVSISRKTGYWKIIFDESVLYNDYLECLTIMRNQTITRDHAIRVIEAVNRGAFLHDLNFVWLDEFKAEIANQIIDSLTAYVMTLDHQTEHELVISIADAIFHLDIVNEEAMIMKCKVMISIGKHSMSNACYQKFANDYKALYGEPYKKSFNEIINSDLSDQ
jgi:two-component SAPR family response regulator